MSEIESAVLEALQDLRRAVAGLATADPKPNLMEMFERIDALATTLPPTTDPTLLHYLKKKSYEKALLFLEGRDAENQAGNCGHVG